MGCPACDTNNSVGATFCRSCGEALQKQCSNGHPMAPGEAQCRWCPVTTPPQAAAPAKARGGKGKTVVLDPPQATAGKSKTVVLDPPGGQAAQAANAGDSGGKKRTVILNPDEAHGARVDADGRRRLVGWLVTFDLESAGTYYVLREGSNQVGRNAGLDVCFPKERASISGVHALILARNKKLYLRDEMSSNGTWVNGEDAAPGHSLELRDGDQIKFGDLNMLLRFAFIPDAAS